VSGGGPARNKVRHIYQHYILPHAHFAISTSSHQRKDIMLALGCPTQDMFDSIKDAAAVALRNCFRAFKKSPFYPRLNDLMDDAHIQWKNEHNPHKGGRCGCF
jgi:hypothetical protein